jgi:hypothetical protein
MVKLVADIATIVAAIVASLALGFGYTQFRDTQQLARATLQLQSDTLAHERESKAIEHFVKFNEIQQDADADAKKYWRKNASLALTEAVFKLTKDDAGWKETVFWMLRRQTDFLADLACATYDPNFVELMRDAVKREVCS